VPVSSIAWSSCARAFDIPLKKIGNPNADEFVESVVQRGCRRDCFGCVPVHPEGEAACHSRLGAALISTTLRSRNTKG